MTGKSWWARSLWLVLVCLAGALAVAALADQAASEGMDAGGSREPAVRASAIFGTVLLEDGGADHSGTLVLLNPVSSVGSGGSAGWVALLLAVMALAVWGKRRGRRIAGLGVLVWAAVAWAAMQTTSQQDGSYRFTPGAGQFSGLYRLELEHEGYQSQVRFVDVSSAGAGEYEVAEVVLRRAAPNATPTPVPAECTIFPADNPWNMDVSQFPLHPNSADFIESIGPDDHLHPDFGTVYEGAPIGIPFVEVASDQDKLQVAFLYDDESDPGPYPVYAGIPIEGGPASDGDRHVLMLDRESCLLYELYRVWPPGEGENPFQDRWYAGSGAIFDLRSNELRPDGWTSADAAGLPIYPGLVRYEEVVEDRVINHALRFTVSRTQRGYIHPATHFASSSSDPDRPPMGLRLRMKAGYDCSSYSNEVQVICAALKKYGMMVADNGSDWFVSGAPDSRWSDDNLGDLKRIPGRAFEVVDTGPIITGR